jgi:hypothetical protein
MFSRRSLLGFLPALGAVAIPIAAEPKEDEVKPIILEHTCDRGWSLRTPEEKEEIRKTFDVPHQQWLKGCGTRFQWHFGVPPYCPKCGYAYTSELKVIASGRYKIVQGKIPDVEMF